MKFSVTFLLIFKLLLLTYKSAGQIAPNPGHSPSSYLDKLLPPLRTCQFVVTSLEFKESPYIYTPLLEQAIELTTQLGKSSIFILPNLKLYQRQQGIHRHSKICRVHLKFPPIGQDKLYLLDFPFTEENLYSADLKRDVVFSFVLFRASGDLWYRFALESCCYPVNLLIGATSRRKTFAGQRVNS